MNHRPIGLFVRGAAVVLLLVATLLLAAQPSAWATSSGDRPAITNARPIPFDGFRPRRQGGTVPRRETDARITKSAIQAGNLITFTLVITNSGPIVAEDVVARDNLPGQLRFVEVSASKSNCPPPATGQALFCVPSRLPSQDVAECTVNGQALSCDLGNLAVNDVVRLAITTRLNAPNVRTIRNTARINSRTRDTNRDNNTSIVELQLR